MSQFGADIFDDEPPTKPPTRKGRKSSQPKASEPTGNQADSAPPTEPKKRPSRRKKPVADIAAEQPKPQAEPVEPHDSPSPAVPPETGNAARTGAEDADAGQADTRREPRGRRGRRRQRDEIPAEEAQVAEPTRRPEPQEQTAEPQMARESDYDEEGEGFGALPNEEPEASPGEPARDEGNFPRFGDERRGRRRRRRRGRRGNRDDAQRGPGGQEPGHGGAPFARDQHAEHTEPQGDRGGYPRDPAAPRPDRRIDRREDFRGRHEHSRDHGRGEDRDQEEDRQPRAARRPHSDFKPAPPPPPAPTPRRIAILVDLARLAQQANEQGGEIAYRKLRAAIAGHDEVVHAVCFATRDLPETGRRVLTGQGFTIEDCDDADACADALAEQASRAQWPVDALVVVGSRAGTHLPAAAGGASVETAGFGGNGVTDSRDRLLPRSCLFVP